MSIIVEVLKAYSAEHSSDFMFLLEKPNQMILLVHKSNKNLLSVSLFYTSEEEK
jgi:hypothetical protein